MSTYEYSRAVWDYLLARTRLHERDERGLTTAEIAAVTALLVGAAVVVMTIIFNAAKTNANNIPDVKAPTG